MIRHEDLCATGLELCEQAIASTKPIDEARVRIKKFKAAAKRVKIKKEGQPNVIRMMLEAQIKSEEKGIERLKDEIEVAKEVRKMLLDYSYYVDAHPGRPAQPMSFITQFGS